MGKKSLKPGDLCHFKPKSKRSRFPIRFSTGEGHPYFIASPEMVFLFLGSQPVEGFPIILGEPASKISFLAPNGKCVSKICYKPYFETHFVEAQKT